MQEYPRDRFPALLARIEPRPWHTTARFLLRSGRAQVQVDKVERPQAAAVILPTGAYLLPLGNPDALLDFLAEEPGIARIWVSDREAEQLIEDTLLGEDRSTVTVLAAGEGWTLPSLPATANPPRALSIADAPAVAALLRGAGEWLTDAFGSVAALLEEGMAVGVEARGRLVSIAATWSIAEPYAEVGAHTDPSARGHGHATACAHALMTTIAHRGLLPQWTSFTADNSLARRLGLVPSDTGVEYRREE